MKETKFSIIIPVYNVEKYIHKCITSILEQNYQNYEIIVVNDGSTDNSDKVIKKFTNTKIKVINKPNGGLSSARNEGLKYISGEYLWFVDGDDYIEKNALTILNDYLQEDEYDIISFKYYKEYENKKIVQIDKINNKDKMQYPLVNTSACTKIFKASFFTKNNFLFDEGKIYEDLSLIPFILCKGKKVKFIEEPLYSYAYRDNSIMNFSNDFNFNRDDKFFAIDMLYKRFEKEKMNITYRNELEYLTIKHLLIVYSTEILPFKAKIYRPRCNKVLEYLDNLNSKWYKNSYLQKSAIATRIYVHLFRLKLFFICKILLRIKK